MATAFLAIPESDNTQTVQGRVSKPLLALFDRLMPLHFLSRSEGIRRSMIEFVERHGQRGDEVA
jgi:hypothetical protein